MSAIPAPQKAPITSAQALLEDWLSVREHASVDRLTRQAAIPYGFIWKKWITWLATASPSAKTRKPAKTAVSYADATELDAERFLRDGPTPASRRNGKSRSSPISPVTRVRYGRVLRELHSHAIALGLSETQPFTEEIIGPQPSQRQRGGQILPPGVFEQMARGLPSVPTPFEARDNAIILLLLQTGMTSSELCNLALRDLIRKPKGVNTFILQIKGDRDKQSRDITVGGRAGAALQRWLMHLYEMDKADEFVFITERAPHMSTAGLFRLIAARVQKACEELGMPTPNHIGPGVIRNTVIVNRLRAGEPSFKVADDMGIKEDRSIMRGLGHHLP